MNFLKKLDEAGAGGHSPDVGLRPCANRMQTPSFSELFFN
jgi:hypothetical protein